MSKNVPSEYKSDTGKSIEDYRNIIKQLKVKVKKLQTSNEDLLEKLHNFETKGATPDPELTEKATKIQAVVKGHQTRKDLENEQGPSNAEEPSFDLSINESCIMKVFKAAQKLGLSLEMLYRAADVESKGCLFVEEFRMFLGKLKIGLSSAEINKLLHMFDEEWTGSILKDDYLLCLAAYGVNSEKPSDKVRNLSHDSLLRFSRTLMDKRFSSEDAFKQIDVKKTGAFTAEQLSVFYKKILPGVSKKERAALFFTLDIDQRGAVEKSKFIDLIEKATKVISDRLNETSHGFSTGSQLLTSTVGGDSKCIPGDKNRFLSIVDKFEKKINGPFTKLLESLVLTNSNPETGINFHQVLDSLSTFGDFLTFDEKFVIFKNLDINKNGNVCFEDLVETFVEYKKPDSNYEFFIINLAKNLQALNVHTEAFFSESSISVDSKLDCDDFCKAFSSMVNLFKDDSKKVFEVVVKDKKNKKRVMGYELINLINSHRSDVEARNQAKPTKKDDLMEEDEPVEGDQGTSQVEPFNKAKTLSPQKTMGPGSPNLKKSQGPDSELKKSQTKAMTKQLDDDDKRFNKLLDILKPSFEKKDFFELDGKPCQTIFNNYLACLRKCNDEVNELKSRGSTRWEDPEFGPTESDPTGLSSMYFYDNTVIKGCPEPETLQWLHLDQICTEKTPTFFDEDGLMAKDVMQSSFLGNCWFVSGLSILATHDNLIRGTFQPTDENLKDISNEEVKGMSSGVYPPMFHYLRKYGIYVFRFFKNFEWRFVMIDDKLPCLPSGDLVYGKCRPEEGDMVPDEYWVSLIEKAFAKIHNCYQGLFSGYIDEALRDMTGFASEKRELDGSKIKTNEQKDELWNMLMYYIDTNSMIGCSADGGTEHNINLDGEDTGLKSGHAYAILDVLEIPNPVAKNYHKTHRLLRIRNPWGFGEWQLKWSENPDNCEKLKSHVDAIQKYFEDEKKAGKEVEQFDPFAEDGTFLMCYKDWRNIFHNLFVALDFPKEWSGRDIDYKWTEETAGGFPMQKTEEENERYAKNPQFYFKLDSKKNKKTQIFLNVSQVDGRLIRGIKYPYKEVVHSYNMCIYKLAPGKKKIEKFDKSQILFHSGKFKVMREICIPLNKYDNGEYIVIVSTKDPGKTGEFCLSIYFDCEETEINLGVVDDPQAKFEEIEEEEEDIHEVSKDLKDLLKIRGRAILY